MIASSALKTTTAAAPVVRRAPTHIPSLDGLRAISFLIVFGAHAGLDWIVPGGFGVTVFFFLSGYLITTLMRLEVEKTGRVSLRHFYLRRALRILPPFYIVLAVATTLGEVGFLSARHRPQVLPVLAQALHFTNYWIAMHGWDGIAAGTGVYWSLAVEEHFYLLFPAAFLLMLRLRLGGKQMAICAYAACAAVLLWRCVLVLVFHTAPDRTFVCTDSRLDAIMFGCALAVFGNPMLDVPATRDATGTWERLLLPLGIALLLLTFTVRGEVFRETLRYTLQGVALTPVFIAAVRWPHWSVFRPLNWAPVRFIGTLSYTLYLVHQAVLAALVDHLPVGAVPRALIALGISYLLAWTMYRLVERPCARIRRRLSTNE